MEKGETETLRSTYILRNSRGNHPGRVSNYPGKVQSLPPHPSFVADESTRK